MPSEVNSGDLWPLAPNQQEALTALNLLLAWQTLLISKLRPPRYTNKSQMSRSRIRFGSFSVHNRSATGCVSVASKVFTGTRTYPHYIPAVHSGFRSSMPTLSCIIRPLCDSGQT